MKKLLLKILLAIDVLAIAIYAVCSQLLVRYDAVSGVMTDGFGRTIVEPPILLKGYLGIGEWVGLGWFIVDNIAFWTAVCVAIILYKKIKDNK